MEKKIELKRGGIRYIVVHHSATDRENTSVEAIRRYHVNNRGFWDIGYHWIVDKDGNLVKGRSEEFIGAHCAGGSPANNFNSIGICVVGNFEREVPTEKQLKTLFEFLEKKLRELKLTKDKVLGHLECKPTLCPGKYLMEEILNWRKKSFGQSAIKLRIKSEIEKIIDICRGILSDLERL